MAFWAVIGLVAWSGFIIKDNISSQADVVLPDQNKGAITQPIVYDLTINPDTTVTKDGVDVYRIFTPLGDIDRVQIPILDKPTDYTPSSSVTIHLPPGASIASLTLIPQLVHTSITRVDQKMRDQSTVQLLSSSIDAGSKYSIEIDFPKGVLHLPLSKQIAQFVLERPLTWWFSLAIAFPALTLLVLLFVILRRLQLGELVANLKPASEPPDDLPPAAVEALLYGHLSKRAIAATLIDLARRKYIMVSQHEEGNFRIGRHKTFALPSQINLNGISEKDEVQSILQAVARVHDNTDIKLFERLLLSKLFAQDQAIADRTSVTFRIGHRMFSEKIAHFYAEIYTIVTQKNYFIQNPGAYHRIFKVYGILLFFIGFAGFIFGIKFFPDPKTALVWVGMIFAALAVISLAPKLPILNDTGKKAYREWSAFKAFLADPQELPYQQNEADYFERYLPYAIAMGVEKQWTARFRLHPFTIPEWIVTDADYHTIEQFDAELFPLINWLGSTLSLARTPTID